MAARTRARSKRPTAAAPDHSRHGPTEPRRRSRRGDRAFCNTPVPPFEELQIVASGCAALTLGLIASATPAAAVDAVMDGANIRRVLDVGCGTGIASQLFLDRGCEVVGVEPDERMAAVAHRRGVYVVVAPFETWTAPADPFDLVVSAQAWHWVDQNIGPTVAADALRPGDRLALFSNGTFVFGRHAPTLRAAHVGPIEACGCFGPVEARSFQWERTYTRDEWLDQLPTHSDHRTLRPEVLSTLLGHIGARDRRERRHAHHRPHHRVAVRRPTLSPCDTSGPHVFADHRL